MGFHCLYSILGDDIGIVAKFTFLLILNSINELGH
jgi:hypothetical protein